MADLRDVSALLAEEIDAGRRPIVRIKGGDYSEVIDQAEAHLVAAEPHIFHRDQQLVYVAPGEFEIAGGLKAIGLRAFPFGVHNLMEAMGRSSDFRKFVVRSDDWRSIDCPEKVAQGYLTRVQQWRVPLLMGISTTPVLLPDGRIIEAEGYDRETGIFLDTQGVEFPAIASNPTKDEAVAALKLHLELFRDFPFLAEVDRAVAVAQTLTLLARRCFAHSPAFACSAVAAGSGKTTAQGLPGIIATGTEPALCKWSPKPEEFDKVLDAALLAGRSAVIIDNIPKSVVVDSDRLCQALTEDKLDVRPLGLSKVLTVDIRGLTVFLNGNGLAIGGDIPRRVVRMQLDAECENPELRELSGVAALKRKVRAARPELVAGGLTIIGYYLQAGCPEQVHQVGSFEEWCALIPSALVHLGLADATASIRQVQNDDAGRGDLASVLLAWHAEFGDVYVTAKIAADRADPAPPLLTSTDPATLAFREALTMVGRDRNGRMTAKRLGRWLMSHQGTIVNGYRFVCDYDRPR